MNRKKIPYGTKLPVVLTLTERDTIRDKTFCDPDFGRVGVVEGNKIKLMMSLDDIEDVQGYIAPEASLRVAPISKATLQQTLMHNSLTKAEPPVLQVSTARLISD
jgi:hypothetical protein